MSNYGPMLPPHLQKKREEAEKDSSGDEDSSFGPALPPGFRKDKGENEQKSAKGTKEDSDEDEASFCPALPPGFKRKAADEPAGSGPSPPKSSKAAVGVEEESSSDDDGGGFVGPLPPTAAASAAAASAASAAAEIANRAQRMKDKIEGRDKPEVKERESWMIELPPEKTKNFGLGPRSFSRSKAEKGGDRSGWTDTPEMKAKKARGEVVEDSSAPADSSQDQDVLDYMAGLKRDQEMERVSKELNEKRGTDSLMDMHSKKLRKEEKRKEKERKKAGVADGKPERREFDRDQDLNVNQFDNAMKANMLKRAGMLNDRFSGGSNKFL